VTAGQFTRHSNLLSFSIFSGVGPLNRKRLQKFSMPCPDMLDGILVRIHFVRSCLARSRPAPAWTCSWSPGFLASWLRLNSNWERFTAAEGAIRNRNAYFYPIPVFGSAIILTSGEGNALKGRLPAGVLPMHWYLVFELGRCFLSPTNNQPLGLSCGGSFLGCFVAHFQILST
jgi:hypothetical protein